MLSPDTQAILLLCASFGQNRKTEPLPLTIGEYNTLASWLREEDMTPQDLLNPTFIERIPQLQIGKIESNRLVALLQRGGLLALKVEEWLNQGLWIISRSDANYPSRLKQQLKQLAPPILYGVGNQDLLGKGGVGIVGSRHVDQEGLDYTYQLVETCAAQAIQVISGGAKGVDQASMLGTLKAGGTVIGVLADSLLKASLASKYRPSLKAGKLTLISAFDPHVGFHVGNAMGRNKYIYALADYGLVISADFNTGGTWAGATEALKKMKTVPVFVRIQENIPQGNQQLLKKGAIPFPEPPWNVSLTELIKTTLLDYKECEAIQNNSQLSLFSQESSANQLDSESQPVTKANELSKETIKTIYEAILPVLLKALETPQDDKSLSEKLDVQIGQLRKWLRQAVNEKKIIKKTENNQTMYLSENFNNN